MSRSSRSSRTTSHKRKRKPAKKEVPLDPAKRILAQRFKRGQLEYQVDWEDNKETGERYSPTWEPAENCTTGLIDSWEKSDSQNDTQSEVPGPASPSSSLEKRRKVTVEFPIAASQVSQEEPPPKKPRIAGTVKSARFQSVSQENIESEVFPREIKDSYEEEIQNTGEHIAGTARIELVVPEDFDRDAYIAYPSSAELSQGSHTTRLTADIEKSSSVNFVTDTPPPVNRRPFIWDEELTDTPLRDSSSYRVPATASSNTAPPATATQQDETVSGESLQAYHTRSEVEVGSASQDCSLGRSQAPQDISSQFAKVHLPEGSYIQRENQTSLSESQSAVENSSSDRVPVQSIEITEPAFLSPSLISIPAVQAGTPIRDNSYPDRSRRFHSIIANVDTVGEVRLSIEQPGLLTESINSQPTGFRTTEESQQKAQYNSSAQFQTQVTPQHRGQGTLASIARSEFSQYAQIVEQVQTFDHEIPPQPSISSSQRTSTQPLPSQIHLSLSSYNPGARLYEASSAPPRVSISTKSTLTKKSSIFRPSTSVTPINRTSRSPSAGYLNMEPNPSQEAPYDAHVMIKREMDKLKAAFAAKQAARRAGSVLSPPSAPTLPASTFLQPPVSVPAPVFSPSVVLEVAANQLTSPTLPVFTPVKDLVAPVSPPHLSPELSPPEDVEESSHLKVINQDQIEFIIPLPLNTQTRDIYNQTIRNYKTQSSTFLTDELFSESLIEEIDNMLVKLIKLCDHQDLGNNDFSTQRLDPIEVQAKWAENVSTKCIFLVEFLLELRRQPSEQHVVVLVRPGRMLEILEALCISHKFVYNHADESSWSSDGNGSLRVTLLPTGREVHAVNSASVVIAFDTTARSVSYLKDIRANLANPNALAPLLSLVITHSVEHLERCFPTDIEDTGRKVKLVSYLHHIDDKVGKLDFEDYPDPARAAKLAAKYIVDGASQGSWPLMAMPDIRTIESSSDSTQDRDGTELMSIVSQSGTKRRSETMMSIDSPKRQKTSDTPRQDNIPLSSTEFQNETVNPFITEERPNHDSISVLQRITALEAQLRKQEETETDLRQINRDLENRCRDYESSIRDIQPKYQEALNDRGRFEYEIKLATEREAQIRKRLDNKDVGLRGVQARRDVIDGELERVQAALSSAYSTSTNPQMAELGSVKAECDRLKAETEALRQRNTNLSKDIDFVRLEYQKGSSTAAALSNDLREAHALIAQLRERADSNRVRVHEIQRENEGAHYRQRIQELEAQKADVIRINERLDADLRAAQNARRSVRGASVPGSPRVGGGAGVTGTMSPRAVSRILQDNGVSRSSSPVVGDAANRTLEKRSFRDRRRQGSGIV